jgi:hypothetical protein
MGDGVSDEGMINSDFRLSPAVLEGEFGVCEDRGMSSCRKGDSAFSFPLPMFCLTSDIFCGVTGVDEE